MSETLFNSLFLKSVIKSEVEAEVVAAEGVEAVWVAPSSAEAEVAVAWGHRMAAVREEVAAVLVPGVAVEGSGALAPAEPWPSAPRPPSESRWTEDRA